MNWGPFSPPGMGPAGFHSENRGFAFPLEFPLDFGDAPIAVELPVGRDALTIGTRIVLAGIALKAYHEARSTFGDIWPDTPAGNAVLAALFASIFVFVIVRARPAGH